MQFRELSLLLLLVKNPKEKKEWIISKANVKFRNSAKDQVFSECGTAVAPGKRRDRVGGGIETAFLSLSF